VSLTRARFNSVSALAEYRTARAVWLRAPAGSGDAGNYPQQRTEGEMRKSMVATVAAVALILTVGAGGAWAEGKVTVTREESKPKTVEIKTGEEVRFINGSGQTAHVWFGGNDAIRFYVGAGASGSAVKFDKPGTYEYTVHITGGKTHAHTGTVVVK
jgi:plastocyanin